MIIFHITQCYRVITQVKNMKLFKKSKRVKTLSESSRDSGFNSQVESSSHTETDQLNYSPTVRRSRTRQSYKNPLNNDQIEWEERPMDLKVLSRSRNAYNNYSSLLAKRLAKWKISSSQQTISSGSQWIIYRVIIVHFTVF